jgi:hypothetical protein
VETSIQRLFSINLLCGIFDDMLIGAVSLDELIKGQNFLHLLQIGLPGNL